MSEDLAYGEVIVGGDESPVADAEGSLFSSSDPLAGKTAHTVEKHNENAQRIFDSFSNSGTPDYDKDRYKTPYGYIDRDNTFHPFNEGSDRVALRSNGAWFITHGRKYTPSDGFVNALRQEQAKAIAYKNSQAEEGKRVDSKFLETFISEFGSTISDDYKQGVRNLIAKGTPQQIAERAAHIKKVDLPNQQKIRAEEERRAEEKKQADSKFLETFISEFGSTISDDYKQGVRNLIAKGTPQQIAERTAHIKKVDLPNQQKIRAAEVKRAEEERQAEERQAEEKRLSAGIALNNEMFGTPQKSERNPLLQIRDIYEKAAIEGRNADQLNAKESQALEDIYSKLTPEQQASMANPNTGRFLRAEEDPGAHQDIPPLIGLNAQRINEGHLSFSKGQTIRNEEFKSQAENVQQEINEMEAYLSDPTTKEILTGLGFDVNSLYGMLENARAAKNAADALPTINKVSSYLNIPLEANIPLGKSTTLRAEADLGFKGREVQLGGKTGHFKIGVSHKFGGKSARRVNPNKANPRQRNKGILGDLNAEPELNLGDTHLHDPANEAGETSGFDHSSNEPELNLGDTHLNHHDMTGNHSVNFSSFTGGPELNLGDMHLNQPPKVSSFVNGQFSPSGAFLGNQLTKHAHFRNVVLEDALAEYERQKRERARQQLSLRGWRTRPQWNFNPSINIAGQLHRTY